MLSSIRSSSLADVEWIPLHVGIILSGVLISPSRPVVFAQPLSYLPQATAGSLAEWAGILQTEMKAIWDLCLWEANGLSRFSIAVSGIAENRRSVIQLLVLNLKQGRRISVKIAMIKLCLHYFQMQDPSDSLLCNGEFPPFCCAQLF